MPKRGERLRKLRALAKGKGVKPPKRWWEKVKSRTAKQYPTYGKKRVAQIVGGIWSQSSVSTKKKIVRKYQR